MRYDGESRRPQPRSGGMDARPPNKAGCRSGHDARQDAAAEPQGTMPGLNADRLGRMPVLLLRQVLTPRPARCGAHVASPGGQV
jgi:hypothetical protein